MNKELMDRVMEATRLTQSGRLQNGGFIRCQPTSGFLEREQQVLDMERLRGLDPQQVRPADGAS